MELLSINDKYIIENHTYDDKFFDLYFGKTKKGEIVTILILKEGLKPEENKINQLISINEKLLNKKIRTFAIINDYGFYQDRFYIVYNTGNVTLLRDWLKSEFTDKEWLICAYQLSNAIGKALESGISHNGLSSNLILVKKENEKLYFIIIGYGLSTILPKFNVDDKSKPFFGDPNYLPPELLSKGEYYPDIDYYALGIILYELIVKKPPFSSPSEATTIRRQIYEKPLPVYLLKPRFPNVRKLNTLIEQLLNKTRDSRITTFEVLNNSLNDLKSTLSIEIERELLFPELEIKFETAKKLEISESVPKKVDKIHEAEVKIKTQPEISPKKKQTITEETKIVDKEELKEREEIKKVEVKVEVSEEQERVSKDKELVEKKETLVDSVSWFKASEDRISEIDKEQEYEEMSKISKKFYIVLIPVTILIVIVLAILFQQISKNWDKKKVPIKTNEKQQILQSKVKEIENVSDTEKNIINKQDKSPTVTQERVEEKERLFALYQKKEVINYESNEIKLLRIKQEAIKLIANKQFDSAKKIIEEGLKISSDDKELKELLEEIRIKSEGKIETESKQEIPSPSLIKKEEPEKTQTKLVSSTPVKPKAVTSESSTQSVSSLKAPKIEEVKIDKEKAKNFIIKGQQELKNKNYKEALFYFKQAKRFDPQNELIDRFIKRTEELMSSE